MGKEVAALRKKFTFLRILRDVLDERGRRVWAAAEANALPHGGISLVAEATVSIAEYDPCRHPRTESRQRQIRDIGANPKSRGRP